jgi:hypothetical protein
VWWRERGGDSEADGGWTHLAWQHLDGNSFLVSVGNVRNIQREEQQMCDGGSDDDEEDVSLQPLDEVSGSVRRGQQHQGRR